MKLGHARALIALIWVGCNSSTPPAGGTGSAGAGSTSGTAPAPAPAVAATPAPPVAPPPADPGFGEVAFKTYESEGTAVTFTSDTKAKVVWHNLVGGAVTGTYTQAGKMGFERIDLKDKVHDNAPEIYQQVAPKCDSVRLTK